MENLGKTYTWQEGDTLAWIACKYNRQNQWIELLDLNKEYIRSKRYIMRAGDTIQIPESWFPIPTIDRDVTNFKGSHGHAKY